ncbi:hypothetical protein GNI_063130 [Gregarina niphandrodes]|uniref:Uncharacterized protein n=1 Tax=Gregarina niphandrodes TaxID=110365 RepID=A0A023B834_GRENI|nr:hypothetical protein GNI_063130 [Gregarina niphandrodes]EZG68221.1 hypothetical protein GNI_063130 [Gregarina niphandrodes]|eukprot:XP_011130023.1 hypothetical protein GNI_063130 [Gregarina niphandrodes]
MRTMMLLRVVERCKAGDGGMGGGSAKCPDDKSQSIDRGSSSEMILRFREEQLQRLASELDVLNTLTETMAKRIEGLEASVNELASANQDCTRQLLDERQTAAELRKQLAVQTKMKAPLSFLPFNGLVTRPPASPNDVTAISTLLHMFCEDVSRHTCVSTENCVPERGNLQSGQESSARGDTHKGNT